MMIVPGDLVPVSSKQNRNQLATKRHLFGCVAVGSITVDVLG